MRFNVAVDARPGDAIIVTASQQVVLERVLSDAIGVPHIQMAICYDDGSLCYCCPVRYGGGK